MERTVLHACTGRGSTCQRMSALPLGTGIVRRLLGGPAVRQALQAIGGSWRSCAQ